MKNKQPVNEM